MKACYICLRVPENQRLRGDPKTEEKLDKRAREHLEKGVLTMAREKMGNHSPKKGA